LFDKERYYVSRLQEKIPWEGEFRPKRKNEKGSDRSLRRSFDRFLLFHFLFFLKAHHKEKRVNVS